MIVVSDTTPVHYLILTGNESILPILFNTIIIPDAVILEMSHSSAPEQVRNWVKDIPDWVKVRSGSEELIKGIAGLGKGETSAIAIAIEVKADAVLVDDKRAIREVGKFGLTVLTTFAVLELAARRGLLNLESAIRSLSGTSFHMPSDDIVQEFLERNK